MSMRKLSWGLFLGLFLIPSLLYSHYVFISMYVPSEGYLSNPNKIIPTHIVGNVTRVTDDYRYYYFQVHEDTGTLILFAPNNWWEDHAREMEQTDFEKYRDKSILAKFENMPKYEGTQVSHKKRSKFIADSFVVFFDKLVELHPESDYVLSFRGHGGGSGELMGGRILPNDAFYMLKEWNRSLGRKLLSIDMSWPCKKASFACLANFAPFTKYYLATDLNQGGFSMDEWTSEKYHEVRKPPWEDLGDGKPYLDYVGNELQRARLNYEYSRQNMIDKNVRQSSTCFDCEKFMEFSKPFQHKWKSTESYGTVDVKQYISENVGDVNLMQLYDDCIVGTVNNSDFFKWTLPANGMYKYNRACKTYLVSITESTGGNIEVLPKSSVFLSGSKIDLIATPKSGYVFNGWSGDVEGNYSSGSFVVDGDTIISASFLSVVEDEEEVVEDEEEVVEDEEEVVEDEEEVVEEVIQHPNFFRWDWLTGYGHGWYNSHWFGTFYNDKVSQWVFHTEHGWLYRVGTQSESMWFWDSQLGWLWTSKVAYPYFFSYSQDNWILYKKETKNPRLFYNFKTRTWGAY